MSYQETKLQAIADAIREKDGTTAPIPANDFPARIRAIPTGGGSCSPFQVAASETTVFVGVIVVSGICKQYQNIKGAI